MTIQSRTHIKILIVLLLVPLFAANMNAQSVFDNACADYTPASFIPHNGNLKALIIYVKFRNDTYENGLTWDWPHIVNGHTDERPAWTEQMLTNNTITPDFEPSITGYFKSMSNSSFTMYGDVYPQGGSYPKVYLTSNDIPYYTSSGITGLNRDISTVVWEAITNLDDEIDFSQYDNNKDGYVDELIIWLRLGYIGITDANRYNGIANLTGIWHNYFIDDQLNHITEIITNDGVKIKYDSGLLADGPGRMGTAVMVHEIGHTMGFGHYWHAGVWNMMGARNGVGIMNTWERETNGWLPANSVQTINTPGTYNINLPDFETTGKSIKLPNQNDGYYMIENRSGVSYYSRMGDWLMPDNGVIITYYPSNNNPYALSIINADHRWQWSSNPNPNCNTNDCSNTYQLLFDFPFQKVVPDINGIQDLDLLSVCTPDGCKNHEGSGGNYGDAFKIGYNQVFSSWSNPVAINGVNNSNVCIDVLNHNADSSYDILIKYDVADAYDQTHPSKPLWLRCEKNYFDPNNGKVFRPKLKWMLNSEPDIAGYKIYKGWVLNPNVDPQYGHVATIANNSTDSWIDEYATLYEEGGGSGVCTYNEVTLVYRIVAFDSERPSKESVRSERTIISGYNDPCAPLPRLGNTDQGQVPHQFSISNYPNPFNPSTQIKFALPQNTFVTVKVYNAIGEEVARLVNNEYKEPGSYSVTFDGSNFGSGIYFYSIDAGQFKETKKMVLIK